MTNDIDKKNIVIMDTNIYVKNFYMKHDHYSLLRDSLNQLNLVWGLPEIVFDEVIGKYKNNIVELNKNIKLINKEIKKLIDDDEITQKQIDEEKAYNKYKTSLKRLFRNTINMIMLPYPRKKHREIADRAIRKLKPFKENGDGYRDTLLWETILSVLASEKYANILFVTNDKKDFCIRKGKNKGKLHPELISDINDLNLDINKIEVFNSLYAILTKYIRPKLTDLNKIKSRLEKDKYIISKEELSDILSQKLAYETIYVSMPDSNSTECVIEYIFSITIDEIEYVSRLNDERLLIEVKTNVEAEFEYYVDKFEIYESEDREYSINDSDWNDWVAQVSIERTLECSAIFVLNEKSKEVKLIDSQFEDERSYYD
jgi:hypothetical protein